MPPDEPEETEFLFCVVVRFFHVVWFTLCAELDVLCAFWCACTRCCSPLRAAVARRLLSRCAGFCGTTCGTFSSADVLFLFFFFSKSLLKLIKSS